MKIAVLFAGLLAVAFAEFVELTPEQKEEARLALQSPDLYDGDIAGISGPFEADERNGIAGDRWRWPNARIPYVIDSSLNNQRNVILRGMEDYHRNTCVKFVQRTNEQDYVKIHKGSNCWSYIGRIKGEQVLSLGNGCHWVGLVVHELGHAVGFFHEQSRSDRDEYLIIYLDNVAASQRYNFQKLKTHEEILYNSFDYNSIMIYGNKAFSVNGRDTLVARNGQRLTEPYEKQGMSKKDIERVNKMYKC